MSHHILMIDTCIWIEIAKNPSYKSLTITLKHLVETDQIKILTTDIIKDEFIRNKDKLLEIGRQKFSQNIKNLKTLIKEHSENKDTEAVLKELDNINHKLPDMIDKISEHTNLVFELIELSSFIEISNDIKLISVEKAYKKEAPFHNSKNNMADSLILETFFKQIEEKNFYHFISLNTNEFSSKKNKNISHEDFSYYFSKENVFYSLDLYKTINEIFPNILEEIEDEESWYEEGRTVNEILEETNKLCNIVWYNRHKYREQQINEKIIKVMDKKNYNVNDQNQIVDYIWEGALKSAEKMEKLYSKEELFPESDFDWGMINGKLSALRWVLGDEWDMLYT
jgi:hypothetical protein